jgi:hypothetical protein
MRIAHKTLQSSDQRLNFSNQLLIWIISMFHFLGCGVRASGNSPWLLL